MRLDLPEWASKVVWNAVRVWTTPVLSFKVGPQGVSVHILPDASLSLTLKRSIDERIEQIDAARRSLATALEAVDELKVEANKNRADLADALEQLRTADELRATAEQEAATARLAADTDVGSFRKIMGIPSRRQIALERAIGFVLGVLASLLASLVWWLITRG